MSNDDPPSKWCLDIEKRLARLEGEVKVLLTINVISLFSVLAILIRSAV